MATDVQHPVPVEEWRRPLAPAGAAAPQGETLHNVRAIARLMDTAVVIPGTNFRIGLDALLGLIPGIGDLIGMVVSTYILTAAVKLGVPKAVIARMLLNVGTDALVGAVPFAGDLFDAAWRANAKNAALLEQALADPRAARRSSTWLLVAVGVAVPVIVGAGIALTIWVVRALT